MSELKKYEFWFVTGAQKLYGDIFEEMVGHAKEIVAALNTDPDMPGTVVYKSVVTQTSEITATLEAASLDSNCAGIITWMHTFSPSKMWIAGFASLSKPLLQFDTQYNRDIPWNSIDMDFMNMNQSAHGDKEHGFITARMRLPRKVISGHWSDAAIRGRIAGWMRSAIGAAVSKKLKVMRIGDNMREVAVTEGDKVEVQIKLGWQVNGWGIDDLTDVMAQVTDTEIAAQMLQYEERYTIATDNIGAIRFQAKVEAALRKMFAEGGFGALTDTFQDLHGMEQLPGLAIQNMMADGFGFGGEGDWKTAALVRVMKQMALGLSGGTSFMEDYTYHFEPGNEYVLGAHMLEVCPSLASHKPRIEVHALGIGGKNDPARIVYDGAGGDAIIASLVDMGGRLRLIVNDVKAVEPLYAMPKLPVARVMWRPMPDISTGTEAWILSGGAHHNVMSYALTAEHMRDWAEMMSIEFVHINEKTTIPSLRQELRWNDIAWKLN
ncbi:MAG: L-arabinose isomerase [Eubacteriales bacterium]